MTTLTVGPKGQNFTTLTAAVAAAKTGDTIDVQAGTYVNDFPGAIKGLTIEGVGGIAKFVATAQPGNGKAIFDVSGNTTLKNLDISGVTVPDANGAAIRYESGNLTIKNTAIHNSQDGILGAADATGSITIDGSEFYGNGTGTGSTHNIYIGKIATFTLTNSYIHDANTGHEIKSRAATNIITNNRIEDNASTASYEIDLPDGGNATISGNTIQKSANSGNHVVIAYGEEAVPNSTVPERQLNPGTAVTLSNNVLVSDQAGAYVIWDTTNASVRASGNALYNITKIDKSGYVSSGGFSTLTTRPALNTSSPIISSPGSSSPGSSSPGNAGGSTTPPAPVADKTPPSLTVAQSVSGTTTSTSNTLSGTVSDTGSGVSAVEIYVVSNGTATDLGAAKLTGRNWSFTADHLTAGTYNFYAVGFDKAGNTTAPISTGPAETVSSVQTSAQPAIQTVSADGTGLMFRGVAQANSQVTVTAKASDGGIKTGTFAADAAGSWRISTAELSTSVVNTLSITATAPGGTAQAGAGSFVLASAASDMLQGSAGKPDVFAFNHVSGLDIIKSFATTAAAGATHDVIDLSATGYTSFSQLQPLISGTGAAVIRFDANDSITLSGVNASSLAASDFRFS